MQIIEPHTAPAGTIRYYSLIKLNLQPATVQNITFFDFSITSLLSVPEALVKLGSSFLSYRFRSLG